MEWGDGGDEGGVGGLGCYVVVVRGEGLGGLRGWLCRNCTGWLECLFGWGEGGCGF